MQRNPEITAKLHHLYKHGVLIICSTFICVLILFLSPSHISGRSIQNLSPEIEFGRKVFEEIKPHLRFVENPLITKYLEDIGARVLRNLPKNDYEFRFFPIISNEINAFALSNGYIFITHRLIQACDYEDELAFVLSHEISHVIQGHLMKFIAKKTKIDLATLAVMVLGTLASGDIDLQEGIPALSMGLNQNLTLNYSRDQEYEADTYGYRYLTQSGYNIEGATRFMEKLRMLSQITVSIPTYLSTHPMPVDRILNIEYFKSILPPPPPAPSVYSLERIKLWSVLETELSLRVLADLKSKYSKDPNNADAIYGLALVKEKIGASEDAEKYYKTGLILDPNDRDILRDYAVFLYKRGRLNEAESKLKLSIHLDKKDFMAYHFLGRVMMDQNLPDDAIRAFHESEKIRPDLQDNYNFLGILYSRKGDEEKSHEYFEKYFSLIGNKDAALLHSKKKRRLR